MNRKQIIQKVYSLSPMQEGMLFHSLMNRESEAYFEQTVFSINGSLDIILFEKSFNLLIERYDILRTNFVYRELQKPKQVVLKERRIKIYLKDISQLDEKGKILFIEEFRRKDRERGFDLTKDTLIRVSVIQTGKETYKVIWSFHHILMDGWCLGIIAKEFFHIYQSLKENKPLQLKTVQPYSDYIKWLEKQNKKEAVLYWNEYLESYEQLTTLPKESRAVEKGEYRHKEISFTINEELTKGLEAIAKKNQVTLNTLFQAMWGILLQKYNNVDDVVFGTVVSGRPHEIAGIENLVGLFINTIPVRIKSDNMKTFSKLIKRIQGASVLSKKYNYLPFYEIQSNTVLKQNLIDHIVVFENYPKEREIGNSNDKQHIGFTINDVEVFEQTNYDFNIVVMPGSKLTIRLNYNTFAYNEHFIKRIEGHLKEIVKGIIINPDVLVQEIEILAEEEKQKILYEFNDTKAEYPSDKTIQKLFEEQVEMMPENTAVVFEGRQLTYRELNEKSNQLARVLREKGVGPDSIEGIMVERSFEMIIGIMGILKAGGAYLPIDPGYPEERIEYMLEDSGTKILLTQQRFMEKVEFKGEVINLEDEKLYSGKGSNLKKVNTPRDLAYVIYTSGTTGKPKGVMIEHYSIVNRINWMQKKHRLNETDVILQKTPYTFDVSVWELFWWTFAGAKLCFLIPGGEKDPRAIIEAVKKNKVTTMHFVPTMLNAFLGYIEGEKKIDDLWSLRQVFCSGEALSVQQVKRFNKLLNEKHNIKLYNLYGPTEATIDVTYFDCPMIEEEIEDIPIGKPIDNIKLYVVDRDYKPQPIEIAGELYISGDGLARGYLNRPELTQEKFVSNPFIAGERMYKTGDLARWLPDGNIEYLGRIDHQVKIRGQRIEPGEIESVLLKHELIKEAVVIAKEDTDKNKSLYAYVISDEKLWISELREYLLKELPEYMIPSYFIQLEKMPLTPNAKIDRKALPEPGGIINIKEEYVAPRNEIEKKLAGIWQEVLGVDSVGINDNFFALGGDSIKAIQVSARMYKYGLNLELNDLLGYLEIGKLSQYITVLDREISQRVIEGTVELTPIQKWFFEKRFTDTYHFNQSIMLFSKDRFDEEIIKKVFNKIVEHHDALRMIYRSEGGRVVQYNRGIEGELFSLKVVDLVGDANFVKKIEREADKLQRSINLGEGPLVKLGLFKTTEGDHLLIVIHHLVVDGVSWRIIFEDLATGYNQTVNNKEIKLLVKTDSFKEWSEKLQRYADSEELLREVEYWNRIEKTDIALLPKDNIIEENRVKDSNSLSIDLSEEDTKKLFSNVNKVYNTEINDILLTALGLAVKEWTGEDRILINLEGHGREEIIEGINIARTVGWFTTAYPVILDMWKSEDLSYRIKAVKEGLRHVPKKGIGYGIIRYLTTEKKKGILRFNLKPEISFNYLGQFDRDVDTGVFGISPFSAGQAISPDLERQYAFDINGMIAGGKLTLTFNYNKYEYNKSTVIKLIEGYKKNLLTIINHCTGKEEAEISPSDLDYNEFSIEELEKIEIRLYEKTKPEKIKIKNIYPLAPMQAGMLFNRLMAKESEAYFEQTVMSVNGRLDVDVFEKSFNTLIERYDILRTVFIYDGVKQPLQVVLKERHAKIYFEDISDFEERQKIPFIEDFKIKDRKRGFDLTKDILMRISVIQTGKETYKLIWSFHHILMDGWCLGIIIKEFFSIYQLLRCNKPLQLEAVQPYSNYIKWLEKQDKEEASLYWKEYLEGYEQQATLPRHSRTLEKREYKQEEISFTINEGLTKGLESIAKKNQVTLNTVFQTMWGILLQRYNNVEDVVFGSVVSGRPHEVAGIENMLGLFINTIPVRIKSGKAESFSELIKQVQETAASSGKYGYLPLYEIQSNSGLKQGLIDHIIVFENYPLESEIKNSSDKQEIEFTISNIKVFEQTNYDFNIGVIPGSKSLINLKYNVLVYDWDFIKKIEGHIEEIAERIIENPDILVKDIDVLTEGEKSQILSEFNDTKVKYPSDKTIHGLFEEQAERTPDKIAIAFENRQLTYRELNEKSNRLARMLREKGIKAESIAGLMVERSPEMIIGIMGILKAGGAYLPIDPEYPAKRIEYLLEDSGTSVLLTTKKTAGDFPFHVLQSACRNTVEPLVTCMRPQIKDLDNIPIPDRSLVDYEKYFKYIGIAMVKKTIAIQATRGCPYQCAYCHKIWPKTHVFRTAEHIFKELKMYYNAGIRRFIFIDDIFNLNMVNSSRFFNLILENNLKIQMFFPNGVRGDILTKEYMDLMVRAGVVNVAFALETASPRLQKLIKKNINLEKLRENIEYLTGKYPHVITELFSMHGFPTETEEEAKMTLDFIKSIKWLHFPYIHILKIYPDTDMAKIAIENGISEEVIERSADLAYHELPDTLPYPKSFTRKYQAEFLNEYFLSKERLLKVLPLQMKILTEDELVQKYNSYLPAEIKCFEDLLNLAGISRDELTTKEFLNEEDIAIQDLNEKIRRNFPIKGYNNGALRILLLDLSQFFSTDKRNTLSGLIEPPLGLMYLLTYLNKEFGEKVYGKIAKSRIDFDSFEEFKELIEDFKPHIIGIRTLTYYRNFFHETVSAMRQWGVNVPIIAGGPYATSSYAALLKDRNIDLVVLGEGEITLSEVIGKIIENGGKLPDDEILRTIPGIAFVENKGKQPQEAFNREVILLDELPAGIKDETIENPDNINTPQDLAYVIYTSGTTGRPKGAMIEHRNVVRLLFNDKMQFDFNEDDVWTMFHSMCFDFSVWEMYGALLYGGKLVVVPRATAREPKEYLKLLKEEGVTILNQTPTAFYSLIDEEMRVKGKDLDIRYIIFGGEALKPMMLKGWRKKYPGTKLINMYGITETTVHVTYKEITEGEMERDISNIGKPIPTLTAYVMNKNMKLVPVGVAGELCVGGDGVGRGYLKRAELTAERFVQNPYVPEERLYRSGDLVRMFPDGDMEYLGRIDQQVKIRGHRIELGEIESRLLKHELVKEAVVAAKEDVDGNKSLCAYIISDEVLTVSELREYLSKELPEYMIPSYFIQLENMPLTSNGKIDRKALPESGEDINTGVEYEAPRNEIEEKLAGIWQDVLDMERVGINDNFFELGGHSLKATTLVSKIYKILNVEVPLKEVFNRLTIRKLGEYIINAEENIYLSIKPVEEREYYPVSSAQKRLLILERLEAANTAYNLPTAIIIEGNLNKSRFEEVLNALIRRHETLRTSFEFVDEEPVQKVHKDVEFEIMYMESKEDRIEDIINQFIQPFDLSKAPLFRVGLVKLSEYKHVLIFDMHHIICDAKSMNILVNEFISLHNDEKLRELKIQYRDFTEWQNELFKTNTIKKQEEYWLNIFNGEIPILNLPTDFPRMPVKSFEGDSIGFEAGMKITKGLNRLTKETKTTLYMVLLAAYNVLLSKYTGQEDIIVGSPIAGRLHADLENIIGIFLNILVIRNNSRSNKTFIELLKEVKENSLKAYKNQEYQYEKLVGKLNLRKDLSRNPLFDTMFVLQNVEMKIKEIESLKFILYPFINKVSKYDLSLEAAETTQGIRFIFEFSTRLFKKETVKRIGEDYIKILEKITRNKEIRIKDIEILKQNEKKKIKSKIRQVKKDIEAQAVSGFDL